MLYGSTATVPDFLYAYNQSQQLFIWKTSLTGDDQYFNAPLYDDQYVYIAHGHKALAYDKFSGDLVWETPIEGFYRPMTPLLIDNRLYFKADNYHLYCIEAHSGRIIWHNDNAGNGGYEYPVYDEHYFYYSDELRFYVIDKKNGQVLFREVGPYKSIDLDNWEESNRAFSNFTQTVPIIDHELGVFFLPDHKRMFCFKIPEEW